LKQLGFQENVPSIPSRFLLTHGASTAAVIMPKKKVDSLTLFACHVDSPCLKLKPLPLWEKHKMSLAQVEPYGHPILSSWMGRPLCLSGAFWVKGKSGIEKRLVDAETSCTGILPHLAIHLDRSVNEKGHMVDPYKDLHVLLSPSKGQVTLESLLKEKKEILFHDLSFVPMEKPGFLGLEKTLIVSPRLDNLLSVFSLLQVMKENIESENRAFVFLFYNHEEVGSCTDEGAESRLFLEVIQSLLPKDPIEAFECKKRSLILSLDMSHAFHPNHEDSSDPRHTPELGKGVVFKISAEQKYAGGGLASASFLDVMKQQKIPIQMYSGRNGMKSGSTVGPILASQLGIPALDIGIGILGMHASAEVASCEDVQSLIHALRVYFCGLV
jgi:aspartyl aminopeptidase